MTDPQQPVAEAFVPQPFGKYFLLDRIAVGGMAEIFRAKTFGHGGFEHLVVIKRILAHLGEDPGFVRMFSDEARVTVALQHPNVVRVHDFGKVGHHWYMAMDHVDGKDLRRVLARLATRRQRLPFALAVHVVMEACKGLQYAHEKTDPDGRPLGIVHRDISPANLLISYEGDLRVADFGIAKAELNAGVTEGGVLKGKYEYMSPEQADGRPLDHRSDLFSLGVVLWELLTGQRAFHTGSDLATLNRVREVDLATPHSLDNRIPAALDAVVMKALAKNPDDRFASAAAMHEALRRLVASASPEQLRERLRSSMRDLFAEQMAEERRRLDAASTIARAQWVRTLTQQAERTRNPPIGALGPSLIAAALLGVVLLFGAAWFAAHTWLAPPTVTVQQSGTIVVEVEPSARIYVDGVFRAEATGLAVDALPAGPHVVRLEADGLEPVEESVHVTLGGSVRFARQLRAPGAAEEVPAEAPAPVEVAPTPAPKAPANPTPTPAPRPVAVSGEGQLKVILTGATWAHVYVDGQKIGRTAPFSGQAVPAGRHLVRVENDAAGLAWEGVIEIPVGDSVTVRAGL